MAIKDYLGSENARNKQYAELWVQLIQLAYGGNNAVLVGHHLTFEADGNIDTENEIPSADCLIFDHTIMKAVFGDMALDIMSALARLPCEQRDARLAEYVQAR